MKNRYKTILVIFTLIFSTNPLFSQSGEIKIKFLGNAGLYLTDGASNVYVDFPYKSGAFGYMKYDIAQLDSIKDNSVFIFTHRHPDHYSRKLVNKQKGKAYGPWNVTALEDLNNILPHFSIHSFKTKHRFASKHSSYLITWHGKRIFISGDTETADTIATVKDIDWAFVPSWIIYNARENKMKIDAKKFAIYHLYPSEEINVVTPGIILLNKQNEVITLPY